MLGLQTQDKRLITHGSFALQSGFLTKFVFALRFYQCLQSFISILLGQEVFALRANDLGLLESAS